MKRFYLILAAVAVVGAGLIYWQLGGGRTVSIPANVTVTAADTSGFQGYVQGSASAPVTIVEYADFQCPWCAQFELVTFPDIKSRLIETGKVRWVYKDYPLDEIHPFARLSAHTAACADEQEKYWQVHALIYQGQTDWARGGAARTLRGYAEAAGLDMARFDECMESARYAGRIQAMKQEGTRLGVNGTPTYLIGGRLYGGMPYDEFRAIVDSLITAGASGT